jgi:hypothetical protein
MTLASERRVVQNPLIRYAEEAGCGIGCAMPNHVLRTHHPPNERALNAIRQYIIRKPPTVANGSGK